jgi:hypothetical protein
MQLTIRIIELFPKKTMPPHGIGSVSSWLYQNGVNHHLDKGCDGATTSWSLLH